MKASESATNCDFFEDRLESWRAGELDGRETLRMQAHADDCARCRREMQLAGDIGKAAAALPELRFERDLRLPPREPAPSGGKWGPLRFLMQRWRPRYRWASLALAAVVAIVVLDRAAGPESSGQDALEEELAAAAAQGYTRRELEAALAELRLAMSYVQQYEVFTQELIKSELSKNVMTFREQGPSPQG